MTERSITRGKGGHLAPCRARPRKAPSTAALLVPAMLVGALPTAAPARAAADVPSVIAVAAADTFRPTFDPASRPGPRRGPAEPAPAQASVPSLALPGGWPAVEVRTILVGLHLLGLCFGLGGATMLDFWILRWMRWGFLPDDVVRTFEFVAKAVSAGLVLLWLSGCGFLLLYGFCDPAKLANPKILAKLLIVGALTVNGVAIHRLVLPYVAGSRAMPLFDGFRRRRRLLFVLSGSLSGVSWYSAFALGLLREFNGRVPAVTLLGVWLTLVLLSTAVMELLLVTQAMRPHPSARPRPHASRRMS